MQEVKSPEPEIHDESKVQHDRLVQDVPGQREESDKEEHPSQEQPRSSTRNRKPLDRHDEVITGEWWKQGNIARSSSSVDSTPTTLEEVLNSSEKEQWMEALDSEYSSPDTGIPT